MLGAMIRSSPRDIQRLRIAFGCLALVALCVLASPARAGDFRAAWAGSRQWIGPEFWASPLYDWQTRSGHVEAVAAPGHLLHLLSHRVDDAGKGFRLETSLEWLVIDEPSDPSEVWAGFAIGVQGSMNDPRHVAVSATRGLEVGIRADGRLRIGQAVSDVALPGKGVVKLSLIARGRSLELTGSRAGNTIRLSQAVPAASLTGNICLAASAPQRPDERRAGERRTRPSRIRAAFHAWSGHGDGLVETGVEPFGPILWTQYTRQAKRVKLSVQMPPLGPEDANRVSLDLRSAEGTWTEIAKAPIDPMARTAVFAFDLPSATGAFDYRVRFPWQGKTSEWSGRLIEDPTQSGTPLKVVLMSCDAGYAFPLPTMVRNVGLQDPNLMFFAGDQIYEGYGGFGVIRLPVDRAMLDYLRKWYQFGWTWRDLLKDRPSVILPDDHDVFQANLWGAGGRATLRPEAGGYTMAPDWVKAVERTQTAHLPDAVDPAPVAQGIGVHFTTMRWGGVPMLILEDRKWKSGPDSILPPTQREQLSPEEVDVDGAQLLGERQERFLTAWAKTTQHAPLRMVLSQSIFCKGHTHSGPALKRSHYDWDSNGWPHSGRQRALRPLIGDNTVMLHGDQHLGLLVRHGVDEWNDGPWAFMVPGTSNGWSRAWWPEGGEVTGDFADPFGNQFSVLAAANPEKDSNRMKPRKSDPPELTAHRKGSGYGMIEVSPHHRTVRFEMWRYSFDASNPRPEDQFEGFPQTLDFGTQ